MKTPFDTPLDQFVADWWDRLDRFYKRAFFWVLAIGTLAFGFEMTNLTLHHDDVSHIFIQDTILGHYLGRFGFGALHYYTQNAYFMPFLQLAEGIVFMTAYGLLVARFWGVRRTLDVVLVAAVLSVFPYNAQLFQYNACTAPFALAHLLAASALMLSTRATPVTVAAAAGLYLGAFSIYQSVVANAATIFCIWAISRLVFVQNNNAIDYKALTRPTVGALLAVGMGGLAYVAVVASMDLKFDTYQAAGEAFSLQRRFDLVDAAGRVLRDSRAFFFWPEPYFPAYLKNVQLALLLGAALLCASLARTWAARAGAVALLSLALVAPRVLQLIHPGGHYHNLTLTAYAVLIAGGVMVLQIGGKILARNLSAIVTAFLIAGYVLQCNWISTVGYLNTLAHYTTLTQILTRLRALPDAGWDGKRIVVVGRYDMNSEYPFRGATGVASEFLDPPHMQSLARLMRDEASFVAADRAPPEVLEYAATRIPWPHPSSVGVVNGLGVVVLSKEN